MKRSFVDLKDPILRADFIRYLVLLGDGGAYSDLDTMSLTPIEDWVPPAYANEVNLVVGVEYDKLDGERWEDRPLDLQFCTWAILAKPGHPLMEITVNGIVARLKALAPEQETTVSGTRASYDDVLSMTGPRVVHRGHHRESGRIQRDKVHVAKRHGGDGAKACR